MMKRNWIMAAMAAFLLLAGGAVWYLTRDVPPPAAAPSTGNAEAVSGEERHTLGNPNAPVTVIEYAALTCPHCAEFNDLVMPALKSKYIDTGKVHYIFRILPIGPGDFKAEGLAVCLPKERYMQVVDTLFRRQGEWGPMQMGEVTPEMGLQPKTDAGLIKLGGELGLDAEKARSCMYDYTLHQTVDKIASEGAQRYQISGVPYFVVNGTGMSAPHTPEELARILDPLLKGK
jgi:protein-disulfide isomerase